MLKVYDPMDPNEKKYIEIETSKEDNLKLILNKYNEKEKEIAGELLNLKKHMKIKRRT